MDLATVNAFVVARKDSWMDGGRAIVLEEVGRPGGGGDLFVAGRDRH